MADNDAVIQMCYDLEKPKDVTEEFAYSGNYTSASLLVNFINGYFSGEAEFEVLGDFPGNIQIRMKTIGGYDGRYG